MSFEKLLQELEAAQGEQDLLVKSMDGSDDDAIASANADGNNDNDDDNDDDGDDKELLTKSLQLDDGSDVMLVDAESLIKSVEALTTKATKHEEVLTKGLQASMAMIAKQGELIKSLSNQVAALGGQGAGRKAVLNISEKPNIGSSPLTKSMQDGQLTVGELLAKSNAAFEAKRITGKELTTIDVAARQGQLAVIDPNLIAKVLA